ncbi:MAG: HPr family phosphocarrier protein [Rhodospirillaceae bacterium]
MAFATKTVPVVNARGLHARAAAKFTALAEGYSSDISVSNGRETVVGRSIMGLLLLAAAKGTEITITASGSDAETALASLCDLVARGFDEDTAP